MVLMPLLERMGVPNSSISLDVIRRGFYPRGGGHVAVDIDPVAGLNALDLTTRGSIQSVRGVVSGFGRTARRDLKAISSAVQTLIRERFGTQVYISIEIAAETDVTSAPAHIWEDPVVSVDLQAQTHVTMKERRALHEERERHSAAAVQCQLVLTTTTGAIIGSDALVESTKSRQAIDPQDVAQEALKRLCEAWDAGGCVDEHTMDQLVIYMALAHGKSAVVCNAPTSISSMHLETAIHFTTMLTGARFELKDLSMPLENGGYEDACIPGSCPRLVICHGIGWTNT
jgi:RNA 3'-terminal phosphate cyclase (ATP)